MKTDILKIGNDNNLNLEINKQNPETTAFKARGNKQDIKKFEEEVTSYMIHKILKIQLKQMPMRIKRALKEEFFQQK